MLYRCIKAKRGGKRVSQKHTDRHTHPRDVVTCKSASSHQNMPLCARCRAILTALQFPDAVETILRTGHEECWNAIPDEMLLARVGEPLRMFGTNLAHWAVGNGHMDIVRRIHAVAGPSIWDTVGDERYFPFPPAFASVYYFGGYVFSHEIFNFFCNEAPHTVTGVYVQKSLLTGKNTPYSIMHHGIKSMEHIPYMIRFMGRKCLLFKDENGRDVVRYAEMMKSPAVPVLRSYLEEYSSRMLQFVLACRRQKIMRRMGDDVLGMIWELYCSGAPCLEDFTGQ